MRVLPACLLVVLALSTVSCVPLFPKWTAFSQGFVETTLDAKMKSIVGNYEYDSVYETTRLSRSNGRYDAFCNGYKNYDTLNAACEQIIVGGLRYMYYPDQEDCCYCCNAEQGCGILKPNWLDDGEYLGITTIDGQNAFKWNLNEGPGKPNTLWETTEILPENRTIIKIQRTKYEEQFIQETKTSKVSPITVPSVCKTTNKCPRGNCAAVRGDSVNANFAAQRAGQSTD